MVEGMDAVPTTAQSARNQVGRERRFVQLYTLYYALATKMQSY